MHDIFCMIGFRNRSRVVDLSTQGCRILNAKRWARSTRVGQDVVIVLDSPEGRIPVQGRVAWVKGTPRSGEMIGVAFGELGETKSRAIRHLAMAHKEALTLA